MALKVTVKELRDVECPYCEGSGKIDVGIEEYSHFLDCEKCGATGEIEIIVERCSVCSAELEWNEMYYGFDENSETIFRCTTNECDRKR